MLTNDTQAIDEPKSAPTAEAPESSGTPSPAGGNSDGNQSITSLAAEFTRTRRSRRAPDSATPTGKTPEGPAPTEAGQTPEPAKDEATDETKAASDSEAKEAPETKEEGADEETKQPKAVRELQRRVDQKTAENHKLSDRVRELEAKLADADKAPPRQVDQSRPWAGHEDVLDLDTEADDLQGHLDWLDRNPDGGKYEIDGKVISEDVPAEVVPKLQRKIERRLAEISAIRATKVTALREKHAKELQDGWNRATTQYPWLAQPGSREHTKALEIVNSLPTGVRQVLDTFPEGRMFLGDVVAARLARETAAPKPANEVRRDPPKTIGAAASKAPSTDSHSGLRRELADAEAAFSKSGSSQDLSRVESIKRRLRVASR